MALREVTSEHQVISHDPSVNGFNCIKWQEMYSIHLLYNKTNVDLYFGRHGVLMNSKLNHIDFHSDSVNMTLTVHLHSMSTST